MSEVKRRQKAMDEILDEAMRKWRDEGELSRLAGRPIDLSDNSPDWFANRLLKNEGFSHPAIERGRDVDQLLVEAQAVADRLSMCSGRLDGDLLAAYRQKLEEYNRAATAYNLGVPDALHKRPVTVGPMVVAAKRRSGPSPED